jgi:hypothetical protein
VLQDRSAEAAPAVAPPPGPVADDDFYRRGPRMDQAW